MYWYSLTSQSTKLPVIAEAEDSLTYLAPYRDDISLIMFSTGEYSKLVATLQAARILGVDYLAMAPDPPIETLKSVMKYYEVQTIPHRDKLKISLLMALAAFFALSRVFKNSLSSRSRRLFEHGVEGFAVTLRSFIEKYTPVVENVLKFNNVVVTSSKFLEASSMLLAEAFRRAGVSAMYLPFEEVLCLTETPILAVFLSTEERFRREFKAIKKTNTLELLINVDPLESVIYLSLLAYAMSRSAES